MTVYSRLEARGFKCLLLEHIISRLHPLDDFSAFDFLLLNLHGALSVIAKHLPQYLPPPLFSLIPVLAAINRYIATVGIGEIATTSDSGRLDVTNPTYGRFTNHPIYACFAEDCTGLPLEAKERILLCLGLILLARIDPVETPPLTRKEIDIADGLRKAISREDWIPARNAIPAAGNGFIRALGNLDSSDLKLTKAQQGFLSALSILAEVVSRPPGSAATHGINRHLLEDDDDSEGPPILRTHYLAPSSDDELEIEDSLEPVEFVETAPTLSKDSTRIQEHRLHRLATQGAQRFVRDNQFLSRHWRTLFDQDAKHFVKVSHAILNGNESLQRKRQAAVGSLVHITSHSPSELAAFVLVKSLDPAQLDTCMSAHVIDVERHIWWHTWPTLPGRFFPNLEQESYLRPRTEWIPLPLPPELCATITFIGPGPIRLSKALSAFPDEMENLHRNYCLSLRERANHISPARVRAHGFDYLVRKTGDDSFASAVQGTLEYAPYSPLYYFACGADVAVAAHTERLTTVGWQVSAETVPLAGNRCWGSRLQPTDEAVVDLANNLAQELTSAQDAYKAAASPVTIARLHNAITLYTAVMAIAATGHRKAHEYSFVRWTLNLYQHFLMASDKIISTALSTRLVSIPGMVADQFQALGEHIRILASRVTRYNPELAAQIRSLDQPDPGRDVLPLLFLLDESLSKIVPLSHEVLSMRIGSAWPLPWNASRHLLEPATRKRGMSAEFNHYRAGHISSGQQPFSETSPLIPEDVTNRTAAIIEELMIDQGWSVRTGLAGRHRGPGHFEREAARRLGPAHLPAPILRAQSLLETSPAKLITSLITAYRTKSGKKGALDDEAVESIREEIIRSSCNQPFLVAERLNLFRKMLISGRKNGEFRLRNLPGLAAQYDERPAFGPDAAWRIRMAEATRQGFLDFLALEPSSRLEDVIDSIVFSLIAFAAFTDPATVAPALRACFICAFTLEDFLWIEFPRRIGEANDDAREWIRRPLDPVTTCLVLQARQHGSEIPKPLLTDEAVNRAVRRIAGMAASHAGLPVETPESLQQVCEMFVPLFRFRLSGIHAAWSEGRLVSVSMARPDFLRLMTGLRPATPGSVPEDKDPIAELGVQPVHQSMSYIRARKLMRRIGQILITAQPDSVRGGKDATHYTQKMNRARKELRDLRGALQSASFLVQALAAWVERLLTEGGTVKDRLQASSVATYFWAIAYPLVEIMLDQDLSALDSAELEDLYSETLDARAEKTRIRRARTLRQFHRFCIDCYGLPDVDWYDIEPLIDSNADYIDANLVTPGEYGMAMAALRSHVVDGRVEALKLSVLAALMFRAGLRLGEAFRLTLDDIIIDRDNLVLLIRANRYGRPKTHNGWRRIHIGWRTPAEEIKLIEGLIAYRRSMCGDVPETALFGSTALPHELDLRRTTENQLTELLRWATGRAAIRPHHLRHSMASLCTASQFDLPDRSYIAKCVSEYMGGAQNPGEALRLELLGKPEPTRRIMHALCADTGHGSPRMLLKVYGHTLDIGLACQLSHSVKESLGDSDGNISTTTQQGTRNINKYARATALSGLSDGRLRRLMHDGIDVTNPVVFAKYLVSRNPIPHGVLMMMAEDAPGYAPAWNHTAPFTLEQIHGAISAAVRGAKIAEIAKNCGINEVLAQQVVDAAQGLAVHCRYLQYGTKSLRNTWNLVQARGADDLPPIPSRKKGGDTYEKFSAVLGRLGEPAVRSGLQAWVRSYRPSEHGLACEDIRDLAAFWTLLLALGYPKERLVITLPPATAQLRSQIYKRLAEIGISVDHIEFSRRARRIDEAEHGAIVPALLIKRSKESSLKPAALAMTTIHQCCYLCAVAMEAIPDG